MTSPAILTFDYDQFIALFPAYANPIQYPQSLLQQYWNSATNYVSNIGNFGAVQGDKRQYAINLMTAHLVYISGLIAKNQVPGLVQEATIDKVHVSLTPPPLKNQWQWWLSVSPYGQQFLALMQANTAGGFYISSGSAPLSGFRSVGFSPWVWY